MKKFVSFILLSAILLSIFPVPALADETSSDSATSLLDLLPDISVSEKLYELLKKADIDELAQKVKDYLYNLKDKSDREICDALFAFCVKYDIQVTDAQLEKGVSFVRKAMDYDVEDIKAEINSVKEKVSVLVRIVVFIKDAINAIVSFFEKISNLFSGKTAETVS